MAINNKKEDGKVFEKVSVDDHIGEVLDLLLSSEINLTIIDAIIIICKLNNDPVFLKNSVVYDAGKDSEYSIEFKDKESLETVKKRLIDKYCISDIDKVKEYIKYNYSSHLNDTKKSNFGKYYTPKSIVEIVKKWVEPFTDRNTYIMDLACGCGAFMEIFKGSHIYGRDIDKNVIGVLKILGIPNVEIDNSLINVNRAKFGLSDTDSIIIVGNPPYNDVTSKNKRFGTKTKTITNIEIDDDIKTNDYGQCFLKAYSKLNPNYICVLHPLAYLIKKSNFGKIKMFTDKYLLKKAVIFSSSIFPDLRGNTEFPVIVGLYEKGNMDYEYIKSFKFDILDSNKKFVLSKFTTIDDLYNGDRYINKYPIKIDKEHIKKSDIDLYQYNIRDTNSLMSSGNLMHLANNDNTNYVTVNYSDFYKYAYLNMYKFFFKNDFLVGNLSPLIDIDKYENDRDSQFLMMIGTILKNHHRIKSFDYSDKQSFLHTKLFINDVKKFAKEYKSPINFYSLFLGIVDGKNVDKNSEIIFDLIKGYFKKIKEKFFG